MNRFRRLGKSVDINVSITGVCIPGINAACLLKKAGLSVTPHDSSESILVMARISNLQQKRWPALQKKAGHRSEFLRTHFVP